MTFKFWKGRGILSTVGFGLIAVSAAAQTPAIEARGLAGDDDMEVRRSSRTGLAVYVKGQDGGTIPVARNSGPATTAAESFLDRFGHVFGIRARQAQLRESRRTQDDVGFVHTTFEQHQNGVPVFSGIVKAHENTAGQVISANGRFYPISESLSTIPTISAASAVQAATRGFSPDPEVEQTQVVVVDPGWYGDPPIGPHLAYFIVLSDFGAQAPEREAFFVDAHTGEILDQWSLIHTARNRQVYDGQGGSPPGVLARSEGEPPVASPEEVNTMYDYLGDTYGYFFRAFGRDSFDGNGGTIVGMTHLSGVGAYWDGSRIAVTPCVPDDVLAHEFTHGVTQYSCDLIYQNQPGMLNEGFSDISGELVDLFNGNVAFFGPSGGIPWPDTHPTGPGLDTPNEDRTQCFDPFGPNESVRWIMGEDNANCPFGLTQELQRDMLYPPCGSGLGTDDVNDPSLCGPPGYVDNGGVHIGSGVPNHAFALMTDGGTHNGYTVTGIGPIKSGAVWYRAQTVYFGIATDFAEAYDLLNQSAADLIGTTPNDPRTGGPSDSMFTAADAEEVDTALLAMGMNEEGICGFMPDPTPPSLCPCRSIRFTDDFESGTGAWTVQNTSPPTPYNWQLVSGLPLGRPGTAWFIEDRATPCGSPSEAAVHSLTSPVFTMPSILNDPILVFTHYYRTQVAYDGGRLSLSVNGGAWQPVPQSAISYNRYNMTLVNNPLDGQHGWSGWGVNFVTTIVDLSTLAPTSASVQVRFEFAKDECYGILGWYVDDFEVSQSRVYADFIPSCGDGVVELSEILCLLDGYMTFAECPDADIWPCQPDGLIELGDLLAVLDAYSGTLSCPNPVCAP